MTRGTADSSAGGFIVIPMAPVEETGEFTWFAKCMIEGLAKACAPLLHVWGLPALYDAHVRFAPEPWHGTGKEEIALPLTVYQRGWGDCDDLCLWFLAERYAAGEHQAHVAGEWEEDGNIHVFVVRADGTDEDPSVRLGARL